jgi:Fe2+ or Zn2+ uptake regulation protein
LADEFSSSPEEAIRQIFDYFLRHPEAVDSADGIAHWRLLEEVNHLSLAETEEGLRWLVAQGFLREVAVPGGKRVYRLNPEMQETVQQLLMKNRRKLDHS